MNHIWRKLTVISYLAVAAAACQTWQDGPKQPPILTDKTPIEEAIEAGIQFGGPTMAAVRQHVREKKAWKETHQILVKKILYGLESMEPAQGVNTIQFLHSSPLECPAAVFIKLIHSRFPLVRQLGWRTAAVMPSPAIGREIEAELTHRLKQGTEGEILIPEVAQAIGANRLKDLYTVLRTGLMADGSESFAQAMIQLNPAAASRDFLEYLAIASPEELRQLTFSSVNLYTCVVILNFLAEAPVPTTHPNFPHLFYYAVSRNNSISDLAMQVMEVQSLTHRQDMAFLLAAEPTWLQVAYVERAGKRMTPNVGLLLAELREITNKDDVLDEIDSVQKR